MSNVSVKKELSQLQSNLMARTRFGASKKKFVRYRGSSSNKG